ncbi:uncharacterized protein LOC129911208 [Episyrphus balteatus]|uniref:uncharacterized protein LOC129911208 n=1 Tax=Episyrphus balteatus TaxID=286459 RepID=UPI0024857A73|nr:uncharacterized protein LOC129911208 [Episyrphus balteatus]
MIQACCYYLFLLFTCVLSYPSIHMNHDKFELTNEFLSEHFGSEFEDAIHFDLHQSDIINPGNTLSKHLSERRNNGNFKRSTYVMHIPQLARHQNYTQDNLIKVKLLHPDELEALERGMKQREMHKSARLPMVSNGPAMAYHYSDRNSLHPHFPRKTHHDIINQNQQHISKPYESELGYQQLPIRPMLPSYEKTMIESLQPSQETKMISQHSEEKTFDSLRPGSFDKASKAQSLPVSEQQSFEKIAQHLNEKLTETVANNTQNHVTDKTRPTNEIPRPFYDVTRPQHINNQPTFEIVQTTFAKKSNLPFQERKFFNEPKPMDEIEKQTRYGKIEDSFLRKMMPQEKIATFDFNQQPLNFRSPKWFLEFKQKLSPDDAREREHENQGLTQSGN